jgi:hypothetical protein
MAHLPYLLSGFRGSDAKPCRLKQMHVTASIPYYGAVPELQALPLQHLSNPITLLLAICHDPPYSGYVAISVKYVLIRHEIRDPKMGCRDFCGG